MYTACTYDRLPSETKNAPFPRGPGKEREAPQSARGSQKETQDYLPEVQNPQKTFEYIISPVTFCDSNVGTTPMKGYIPSILTIFQPLGSCRN